MGFFTGILGIIKDYFAALKDAWMYHEWMGVFILVVIGLVVSIVVGAILISLFLWLERIGTPIYEGHGRIIDKEYEPESTTYITTSTGKGAAVSVPVKSGPNYYVEIYVPGGTDEYDTVSVDRKFYNRCSEGNEVNVRFRYGRFTGLLHICDLWG